MAYSLPSPRSRISRSSLSTPVRGLPSSSSSRHVNGLTQSPSTPYEIYSQLNPSPLSTASPRAPSAFLTTTHSNQVSGVYRRNAGFGSPGLGRSPRYSSTGVNTSSHNAVASPRASTGVARTAATKAPRYIRKKSLPDRLRALPSTIYDWILFHPLFDFADPAIGYPAGLLLHLLSLIALTSHPEGPLHLSLQSKETSTKTKGLFGEQSSGGGSGLAFRRRQAQEDAWRYFATTLMFSLLVLTLANAYNLFTARRRYHLWMKPTAEKVSSENASLVDMPQGSSEDKTSTIREQLVKIAHKVVCAIVMSLLWVIDQLLHRVRMIPYLGIIFRFLFPPHLSRRAQQSSSTPMENQMHAIDMWTAPDVQLRIFCLYSPLHAAFYLLRLKDAENRAQFLNGFALMVFASAQMTTLVQFYSDLVKDKTIVAGEVMHEYDEKFVKPRAMTVSRDVAIMTDEAELGATKRQSWLHRKLYSDEEELQSSSSSQRPRKSGSRARQNKSRQSAF